MVFFNIKIKILLLFLFFFVVPLVIIVTMAEKRSMPFNKDVVDYFLANFFF